MLSRALSLLPGLLIAIILLLNPGCREVSQPALQAEGGPLFPVEQNGQWGYVTRQGTLAIQPQFEEAYRFTENRALVRQDGRFGFIDRTGSVVIPAEYADAWHFSEGLAPVRRDSLWGFINPQGDMVVDAQFTLAPRVVEESRTDSSYSRTKVNGQVGYRDKSGTLVIPPAFEQAWYFSEDRARIKQNGQWGYINRDGEIVIEPRFGQAWDFRNGLARVRTDDGQMGYITPDGTLVWPKQQ